MSRPRIFVVDQLSVNQDIVLDQNSSKHLLQVLRFQIGDLLVVFNGNGGEFLAKLKAVTQQRAIVTVLEYLAHERGSPLVIHLAQGISRGEKMDLTIQKAVELGVKTITPLFTERCNVKLSGERLVRKIQHWQKVAISALEQSGRTDLVQVFSPQDLGFWLNKAHLGLNLLLDPEAPHRLGAISKEPNEAVTILIGPEGGLSEQEFLLAKQNNFTAIKLGNRVLRTETAALATISALQTKWGDF